MLTKIDSPMLTKLDIFIDKDRPSRTVTALDRTSSTNQEFNIITASSAIKYWWN